MAFFLVLTRSKEEQGVGNVDDEEDFIVCWSHWIIYYNK